MANIEADIDLSVLKENMRKIKAHTGTRLCFVVKANAYGHGIIESAKAAKGIADEFAVATFEEAFTLREAHVTEPVNILCCADEAFFVEKDIHCYSMSDIIPCVSDINQVKYIGKAFKSVNIKINSGMNRLGASGGDVGKIVVACRDRGIKVRGFFTHFHNGGNLSLSSKQLSIFLNSTAAFADLNPLLHACASSCVDLDKSFYLDMVRCGIAAYGYSRITRPVMSVYTSVVQVHKVKGGEHIGYGEYLAPHDMTVAAIRAGYGDGYRRRVGSKDRFVSINGVLCPVAGQVCMDITLVDVSNASNINRNDRVYLLGESVSGEMLAESCSTIVYDVLTSFNGRVKRNYISAEL